MFRPKRSRGKNSTSLMHPFELNISLSALSFISLSPLTVLSLVTYFFIYSFNVIVAVAVDVVPPYVNNGILTALT